jgi:hypothetical protein
MRIVTKTVAKLVPQYSYDPNTGPQNRQQSLELSREDADKLANDKRTLLSCPLNLNHRPGAPVGRVLKGWVENDGLYHCVKVFDEDTKQKLREGHFRNVSLFHTLSPHLMNLELTLCALKGSREDTGVIQIFEEDDQRSSMVSASDDEISAEIDPDVESERTHYKKYYMTAASDDHLPFATTAPLFSNQSESVTIMATAAPTQPETAPTTVAPAEEEKQKHRPWDEWKAILDKFQNEGVRPSDSMENEPYDCYLLRLMHRYPGNIPLELRERIMLSNIDLQNRNVQMKEEQSRLNQLRANQVSTLLAKFGHRASPSITHEAVERARRENDDAKMQEFQDRMMMIAASDAEMQPAAPSTPSPTFEAEMRLVQARKEAAEAEQRSSEFRIRQLADERMLQDQMRKADMEKKLLGAYLPAPSSTSQYQPPPPRPAGVGQNPYSPPPPNSPAGMHRAEMTREQQLHMDGQQYFSTRPNAPHPPLPPPPQSGGMAVTPYNQRRVVPISAFSVPDGGKQQWQQQMLQQRGVAGRPDSVMMRSTKEFMNAYNVKAPALAEGHRLKNNVYTAGTQWVAASDDELFASGDTVRIQAATHWMGQCMDKALASKWAAREETGIDGSGDVSKFMPEDMRLRMGIKQGGHVTMYKSEVDPELFQRLHRTVDGLKHANSTMEAARRERAL